MTPDPAAHTGLVRSVVAALVRAGSVPPHLADDAAGYGFLGLMDAAARYDGRAKFSTYATIRVRGAVLSWLRRELGRPVSPLVSDRPGRCEPSAMELGAWWAEACRGLTHDERCVLVRHYRHGWPLSRVALSLGKSVAEVKRLLASALGRLRQSETLLERLAA